MKKNVKKKMLVTAATGFLVLFLSCVPVFADSLADAIAKTPVGTGEGMIAQNADPGYLDIPGAPRPMLVVAFLWAVWVGWIFSTVGAFGGIMAGVGHLTVYGLASYAKTFKTTSPALNTLLTDSIRVSNQWLGGVAASVSSFNYWKMGRLVLPLGIALAIGSITGSFLVPVLTAGKITLKAYIGYFGLVVLIIGGFLFYETTPRGQNRKKEASAAANAFEKAHMESKESGQKINMKEEGVKVVSWSMKEVKFTFFGVEFSFRPIVPVLGGFFIGAMASFLGIGGGFLFVPFLTSIAGLPMFLVAGTSALTVLVGMVISIFTYMVVKGVPVWWLLIGVELLGVFTGAMIGPRTSKYIPDVWLKRLFVVLALYVGIRYTSIGFMGKSILPPF